MKKINDSNLFLYSAIITIVVALLLGIISFYSILKVEPEIKGLLDRAENIDSNSKKAYIMLRNPQIFAGYEFFDADGMSVKNTLMFFDKLIYNGMEIDSSSKKYLDILLERRKQGSRLGRNTMMFFAIISLFCWLMFFYERTRNS